MYLGPIPQPHLLEGLNYVQEMRKTQNELNGLGIAISWLVPKYLVFYF